MDLVSKVFVTFLNFTLQLSKHSLAILISLNLNSIEDPQQLQNGLRDTF